MPLVRCDAHSIELNCMTFTNFVHRGLAHFSFVRLLYFLSSRN